MKSFKISIATIILMIAVTGCSGSAPGVLQFGSSGNTSQPAEASATAEATSPAKETAATATDPALPEPTEEVQESTPQPTSPAQEWPDGTYTVTHDEGGMVCESGMDLTIPAGDITAVTLAWQNGDQTLELSGFEGQTMLFTRSDSGEGGFSMVSQGVYGGVPMTFTLYFFYGIEWIEGTIEGEIEGCSVNRSFVASPN